MSKNVPELLVTLTGCQSGGKGTSRPSENTVNHVDFLRRPSNCLTFPPNILVC